ncbi:MAG TPA: hypothetical protein VGA30_08215 [Actinomycetota bacterium]
MPEGFIDLTPESDGVDGVDGGESKQIRPDLFEEGPRPAGIDEAPPDHFVDVSAVLGMAPLDLGQGLRMEIEVVEAEPSFPGLEDAPALPARRHRDEVGRRRPVPR